MSTTDQQPLATSEASAKPEPQADAAAAHSTGIHNDPFLIEDDDDDNDSSGDIKFEDHRTTPAPKLPDDTTGPPTSLVPATRSSLAADSGATSQASNITQAAATPHTELSANTPVSTPGEAREQQDVDPKVATLQGMFPDFDTTILHNVLEACGGNPDQAVEMLLSMSDPEYKPPPGSRPPTQEDLDEELARRLDLEEREATLPRAYQPRRQQTQPEPTPGQVLTEVGSQVKSFFSSATARLGGTAFGRGGAGNGIQPDGQVGATSQTDYSKQFNELAESGKKQFGVLVGRVKAKMAEYDTPAQGAQSPVTPQTAQNPQYGGYGRGGYRPQQQQYAEPTSTYTPIQQTQPTSTPTPQPPQRQQTMPVSGYTVTAPSPRTESPPTVPASSPQFSGLSSTPGLPTRSSFEGGDAPRANFDTSRLGLKPKRPVSLLNGPNSSGTVPTTTTVAATTPAAPAVNKGKGRSETDDIEYVTSPFDDE